MKKTILISILLMMCTAVFALDNRDKFVAQLVNPAETVAGAEGLFDSYQLGGVRTIIKNFNQMPPELAMQYAYALRNLDLFRFRNDMNANLQNAKTLEQKGIALLLLSSLGRRIDSSIFQQVAENPAEDIKVRLSAATCLCAIQNPKYFDLFAEIAELAVCDPETGQNSFIYCDFSNVSKGMFYYLLPKLDSKTTATNGVILSLLQIVSPGNSDFYTKLLDLRKKDYYRLMIDRAARVGAVDLLDLMSSSKRAKKLWDQIKAVRPAAAMVAKHKDQLFCQSDQKKYPIGSLIPRVFTMNGKMGLSSGIAIVKVDESGNVSILEEHSPAGVTGAFSSISGKKTMAAKLDFVPVESYYVLYAPN
ncbi:MAG: hypothetical protein CR997_06545 [Acidobacteria bacterium]|nr:MAG: hypothetical protein CR997_06545 [Acidobacteriota bacterium]